MHKKPNDSNFKDFLVVWDTFLYLSALRVSKIKNLKQFFNSLNKFFDKINLKFQIPKIKILKKINCVVCVSVSKFLWSCI